MITTLGRSGRVLLFAVAMIFNLSPLAHADESCPSSTFTYYFKFHGGDTTVEGATFDTTIVNGDGDTTRVGFDRIVRRLTVNAVGRVWAGERVRERLDVTGVPSGTLIPATITCDLHGEVVNVCGAGGCGAYFTATLASGADSSLADESLPGPCGDCSRQVSTMLSLPVTLTAGTPTEVEIAMLYHTSNVAWGRALVTCTYAISGLPAGVAVVPCSQAVLTPVRRSTWGGLKAGYR